MEFERINFTLRGKIFTFVKKSPAALHVIQQRIFAVTIRLLSISPLILQR